MAELSGAIAGQLQVIGPGPERRLAIAHQLFGRIHQSALDHRGFVTLRREDLAFNEVAPGVSSCTLRQDAAVRIVIVHLHAGTTWSWPGDVVAQELLVISGTLLDGGDSTITPYQHRLIHDHGPGLRAGAHGAQLYVRQLISLSALPIIEQPWWTQESDVVSTEWLPLSEGVDLKSLRCVGDVISKLARVAPGAAVGDHGHLLDEDCMMLEGDLFLGDILLRARDYQMAPAGGEHVNARSDTGALFYFHGHLAGTH